MSDILKKALKLKTAAERGDEQIRDLARRKYNEYLIDHHLTEMDVNAFEKGQSVVQSGKSYTVMGKTFYSMQEFKAWYEPLSLLQKLKVLAQIGASEGFKNLK